MTSLFSKAPRLKRSLRSGREINISYLWHKHAFRMALSLFPAAYALNRMNHFFNSKVEIQVVLKNKLNKICTLRGSDPLPAFKTRLFYGFFGILSLSELA